MFDCSWKCTVYHLWTDYNSSVSSSELTWWCVQWMVNVVWEPGWESPVISTVLPREPLNINNDLTNLPILLQICQAFTDIKKHPIVVFHCYFSDNRPKSRVLILAEHASPTPWAGVSYWRGVLKWPGCLKPLAVSGSCALTLAVPTLTIVLRGMVPWEKRCTNIVSINLLM